MKKFFKVWPFGGLEVANSQNNLRKSYERLFGPGANVIKLFCPWFTDFWTKLECLLDYTVKKLTNDKHSSLLQKSVIYEQKSFITLGPGVLSW
jgi:hypothetical protein